MFEKHNGCGIVKLQLYWCNKMHWCNKVHWCDQVHRIQLCLFVKIIESVICTVRYKLTKQGFWLFEDVLTKIKYEHSFQFESLFSLFANHISVCGSMMKIIILSENIIITCWWDNIIIFVFCINRFCILYQSILYFVLINFVFCVN